MVMLSSFATAINFSQSGSYRGLDGYVAQASNQFSYNGSTNFQVVNTTYFCQTTGTIWANITNLAKTIQYGNKSVSCGSAGTTNTITFDTNITLSKNTPYLMIITSTGTIGKFTGAKYNYTNGMEVRTAPDGIALCHDANPPPAWIGFNTIAFSEDYINISTPTPTNNYNSPNAEVNFSATMNNTYTTNVSLYINSTLNETKVYSGGTNTAITFNKTFSEGAYTYYISAVQGNDTTQAQNTTIQTFYIDTNSITITIYDENGSLVNENITIKFTSTTQEFTNTSNLSSFYIDNLNSTSWLLLFSSGTYTPRTYAVTISNTTHQFLDVYLTRTLLTTIFNIEDNTNIPLENVLTTMYKSINNSWVAVESKYSDITGKSQFSYVNNTNYKFYMSKSGFNDLIFYLNPILLSSYDITLTRTTTQTTYPDYDGVSLIFHPYAFYPNAVNQFTFIIQSPGGTLTNYGYNLTYPSSSNASAGTNAIGGTLTTLQTLSNAQIGDRVRLDYYYTTTTYGRRNFTEYFTIYVNSSYINNTFVSNQTNTYGLGLIERLFIATLLIIFVAGISAMLGKAVPGLIIGMLLYGWMVYIGFIPLWSILLSITIGILILGLRGNNV